MKIGLLPQLEWNDLLATSEAIHIKTIIHTRVQQDLQRSVENALSRQPKGQVIQSDIMVAVAGGLWGAASAWLKTTAKTVDATPQDSQVDSVEIHII